MIEKIIDVLFAVLAVIYLVSIYKTIHYRKKSPDKVKQWPLVNLICGIIIFLLPAIPLTIVIIQGTASIPLALSLMFFSKYTACLVVSCIFYFLPRISSRSSHPNSSMSEPSDKS